MHRTLRSLVWTHWACSSGTGRLVCGSGAANQDCAADKALRSEGTAVAGSGPVSPVTALQQRMVYFYVFTAGSKVAPTVTSLVNSKSSWERGRACRGGQGFCLQLLGVGGLGS